MSLDVTTTGDTTVFSFSGRLDSNNAPEADSAVLGRIDEGCARIILDFTDLDYVSSAGLRVVLATAKRLRGMAGRLAICGMKEHVRDVFAMSGFLAILTVCPDRAEAERVVGA